MPDSFETPDGTTVPAVTADEMREVDRVAVEDVGVSLLQMMEHAGRALATEVQDRTDGPVTVLAGSGGNGGGGLCAARHLLNREREVRVVLDRAPEELSGAAASQWRVLDAMGVAPAEFPTDPGLVLDALVGYGLSGALRGRAADLVARLADERVLSLDVPSGVDATTGERPGPAVAPEATLTLALPKTGLSGAVVLADIGLPAVVYERAGVTPARPFGDRWRVPLHEPTGQQATRSDQ